MDIRIFSGIVSQKQEGLRRPDLFYPVHTLSQSWVKKVSLRKLFEGRRNNSYTARIFFNFRKSYYNLVVNTHFWVWSNFNSFASVGSLMTNDGALELSHQGEFAFCHLAGGRNKYKIIICWGQTDSTVRLGSTKCLCLGQRLKHVNPLEMT